MAYLIDTDVLVDHLRGRLPLEAAHWLRDRARARELSTSVVVLHELWAGAESPAAQEAVRRLVGAWPILEVSVAVALEAGAMRRRGRAEGITLHAADALIAATAVVHRLTVVTRNGRDFPYARVLDPREVHG